MVNGEPLLRVGALGTEFNRSSAGTGLPFG